MEIEFLPQYHFKLKPPRMTNYIKNSAMFGPREEGSNQKKLDFLFFLVQDICLDTTLVLCHF